MDKIKTCPYNKSHQVLARRMPKHLIKCRRSHSTAGTKVCIFNNSHVYHLEDIHQHQEMCPDRIIIEKFCPPSGPIVPQDDEAWKAEDNEDWEMKNFKSYNPMESIEKRRGKEIILTRVQHGTPSELRNLRAIQSAKNKEAIERQKALTTRLGPDKKFSNRSREKFLNTLKGLNRARLNSFHDKTEENRSVEEDQPETVQKDSHFWWSDDETKPLIEESENEEDLEPVNGNAAKDEKCLADFVDDVFTFSVDTNHREIEDEGCELKLDLKTILELCNFKPNAKMENHAGKEGSNVQATQPENSNGPKIVTYDDFLKYISEVQKKKIPMAKLKNC